MGAAHWGAVALGYAEESSTPPHDVHLALLSLSGGHLSCRDAIDSGRQELTGAFLIQGLDDEAVVDLGKTSSATHTNFEEDELQSKSTHVQLSVGRLSNTLLLATFLVIYKNIHNK